MATLSVECNRGRVSVDAEADEKPADVATRLSAEIARAGGLKGSKAPRTLTRSEIMNGRDLMECAVCKTWIPRIRSAAERHQQKYHAA